MADHTIIFYTGYHWFYSRSYYSESSKDNLYILPNNGSACLFLAMQMSLWKYMFSVNAAYEFLEQKTRSGPACHLDTFEVVINET